MLEKNPNWNKFQLYTAFANYEITGWYLSFINFSESGYIFCAEEENFPWHKHSETDNKKNF